MSLKNLVKKAASTAARGKRKPVGPGPTAGKGSPKAAAAKKVASKLSRKI